jgi:hypothetical protein
MKKTITAIALLAGAVTGYSQGQMTFLMDNSGNYEQAIYNVQGGTYLVTYGGMTVMETVGSSSIDKASGTTVYTAPGLGGTTASGTAYDAQLLLGNGSGDSIAQLSAIGGILNFYTGVANQGFAKSSATITVGGSAGQNVTVATAAWAVNSGGDKGAANTLAAAISDALLDSGEAGNGGYAWGISQTGNVTLATGANPAASMPTSVESFSLGQSVPEPSTIALGVIGMSALLFRRRK